MRAVRRAGVSDAPALAHVTVTAWRAAYAGIMPQECLDRLDLAESQLRWRRRLEGHPDDLSMTLVLTVGKKLIGYATICPSRDRTTDPWTTGELIALYLLPDHWSQGEGRLLLTVALERLVIAGFDDAILWVLEGNKRARRFYETAGWLLDVASRTVRSYGAEVRYRRRLR